ncbi:flavodoxin domain-containing protein [Bacillus sp. T33-2]|uniref:flavodoxin domain-containing protein n=1 Tax=Bacillus sp. T33-2 TaxID=2054168 RepID=UPI000C75FFC7|nr:flavodoxin domain-containing protein [Bacillus sp. T33-2]PLR98407.1 flavodoxin [Bacillus sp. T33-2]
MIIALVYTSVTGNTKELADILHQIFRGEKAEAPVFNVEQFPIPHLTCFDAVIICTYTWGNGNIPHEMAPLYQAFEEQDVKNIVTGVAGTGDHFYPEFCGAVDDFRDMLYVHTNLAATLKIELLPQAADIERCRKFVAAVMKRLRVTLHETPGR